PRMFDRQPALFLTEDRFLAAERVSADDDTRWELALYTVEGERLRTLPRVYQHHINVIALSPTRTSLLVAAEDGRVELISTDRFETTQVFTEGETQEPTAVDLGPGGLAVVTRNERPEGQGSLELWDTATGEKLDTIPLSQSQNSYACSFSPDGRLLAVSEDDAQEVLIFRLQAADGSLSPRPLNHRPPTRLRGRGRVIHRVRFDRTAPADQSLRIGLSLDAAERITTTFDLQNSLLEDIDPDDPPFAGVEPETFAGGWSIGRVRQDMTSARQDIELRTPRGRIAQVSLDVTRQGAYRGVHCFVPDAQGQPFAVALGTDTQAGIFLYRLRDEGGPLELIRYFRDHLGDITSMSASPDGRYLLSGARDQTIKLWSLANVGIASPFRPASLWGAEFAIRGGPLLVQNVDPAGIAYHRNLRNDDRVELIVVSGPAGPQQLVEPKQILAALEALGSDSSVYIQAVRNGQRLPPRVVVPGWEPLLTIFIDDRDEWAVFTPEGYYDASVAEGPQLFGWQQNRGSSLTPRFDPGGNLQKEFERPDVIRDAVRLGSVAEALTRLQLPPPPPLDQKLAAIPVAQILSPLQSEQFETGSDVPLVARVDFPDAAALSRFEVQAFQSGRALGPPDSTTDQGLQRRYTWSTSCDESLNQFTVVVREIDSPVTQALQQSDTRYVRGQSADQLPTPRVHILAIGLEDYHSASGLAPLLFAIDDVHGVVPRFTDDRYRARQLFLPGPQIAVLTDHDVSLRAIEQAVAGIEAELDSAAFSRRDLVVCVMCGHGSELDGEFYLHPTSLRSSKPDDVRQQSIPWSKLCARLNALPCHVVWMIDACHSGAAVDAAKAIVREANLPNRFVLAASTMHQVSFEDAAYKVDDEDAGHGAFTMAVLRGLDGLADADQSGDGDGVISASELAEFVRREVRSSTVRRQTPCYVPTASPPLLTPGSAIPLLKALPQPR
ncbi:MAG: caspase family protein, partial [Planctomycetaceae bacterium]|nr:caspase family protein [Planctomycetaceae bacterium]